MNAIDYDSPILIYSANRFDATGSRKLVGGFADRLKGICFTFALSKLTNRQFFIDWDNPSRLADVFSPNGIMWDLPQDVKPFLHDLKIFNLIDEFFTDELKAVIKENPLRLESQVFNNTGAVVLNCNSLNLELFQPHGYLFDAYGIDTTSAKSFFRSILDILFSDEKILELPGYKDFMKFKSSVNVVIGAQFRTGGDGQWHDPALDSVANSEAFAQSVLDYAVKLRLRSFGVFLSTDSQVAKDRIGQYLGGKVPFFCYSSPPVHIERSAQPEASSGVMQVALEHTALSRTDYVIVGEGEFGVTAAYRGDKTPVSYKSICPPIGWGRLSRFLRCKIGEFRR